MVKDIVKHLQTQINPLFCKNIIECKNVKMSHLLIIASTILMTPGSLRQPIKSGEGANDRPSGLWRQTGYLHSSIDAIIRCKIIDTRVSKNTVSRRMTSKRLSRVSESEF